MSTSESHTEHAPGQARLHLDYATGDVDSPAQLRSVHTPIAAAHSDTAAPELLTQPDCVTIRPVLPRGQELGGVPPVAEFALQTRVAPPFGSGESRLLVARPGSAFTAEHFDSVREALVYATCAMALLCTAVRT